MTLDDIPIFTMLKGRLNYLSDRQRVIAENVANADTPGYAPRDLKPFTVPTQGGMNVSGPAPLSPVVTSPMHISPPASQTDPAKEISSPDSETTLNGNSVVLEEEMEKMSEARTDYQAAIGLYEKSLSLIQLAIKRPGA